MDYLYMFKLSMPFTEPYEKLLALSRLNDLFIFKLQLEATYGKRTLQEAYLLSQLSRYFLTYYSRKLMDALAGKESQCKNMRNYLEREIAEGQKQFLKWVKELVEAEKKNYRETGLIDSEKL